MSRCRGGRGRVRGRGRVGLVAFGVGVIGVVVRRLRPRAAISIPSAGTPLAWAAGIGVYLLLFLRLPVESGYLIVTVPFVILLAARYVPRLVFIACCVLLLVSPWVEVRSTGVFPGPILQNRHVRRVHLSDAVLILQSAGALGDEPSAVTVARAVREGLEQAGIEVVPLPQMDLG